MENKHKSGTTAPSPDGTSPIRCAIYTRKSTTENLDTDFNSLDAQREACQAYIKSQAHEGWTLVNSSYDDGGFSGGNIERPAFQRLLTDVDAGKIDRVVVYKIDRLSRSLLDFARVIERFEKSGCSLVSITQQFDNSTSMGRLIQALLMSFAVFERDMISERTRDKMGAARKKGKWTGGYIPLGYELDGETHRLVIHPQEAKTVQRMFRLYLDNSSVLQTAGSLNAEGLKTKPRAGKRPHQGGPWTKTAVHKTLTSPIYTGMMPYQGKIYPGEHQGIIEKEIFEQVQTALRSRRRVKEVAGETNSEYILTSIFYCACGSRMTSGTSRNGKGKEYRYYRCSDKAKGGAGDCTNHFYIPGEKIENFIAGRIAEIAKDRNLRRELERKLHAGKDGMVAEITEKRKVLTERAAALEAEGRRLVSALGQARTGGASLIGGRIGELEREIEKVRGEIRIIDEDLAVSADVGMAMETMLKHLDSFGDVWDVLIPQEKKKLLKLLVKRITFIPTTQEVTISLHDLNEREGAESGGTSRESRAN